MTIPVIEKQNYSDQVFNYIFEQIDSGKLKSGDKLPNERELSESLGISRPSLREALKALSSIGLLSSRHGGGTYVNEFGQDYLNSMLRFLTVIDSDFIIDFIQMRKIIETECARLAASFATQEQIDMMEDIHKKRLNIYEDNINDLSPVRSKLQKLDFSFHQTVALASKNIVFISFVDSMHNIISKHQNVAKIDTKITIDSLKFHEQVITAIKNHDGDKAASYMYNHIDEIEKAITKDKNL
jgi:GntR family transcriptional repressor for pyruvate dehydrogenase complex